MIIRGVKVLSTYDSFSAFHEGIKTLTPDPHYPHDPFSLIVLEEALTAAKEGNFGIGACPVRKDTREVIHRGRNTIFKD